ncbi:hypothetical protein ACI2K4_15290 [Micromonospora sp. NPDC050397]|uniref:hypothetical protein n=1 Tax=Micromonospora sp. NPDC050397 TaxID=3364279 RepID=UPI00384ED225
MARTIAFVMAGVDLHQGVRGGPGNRSGRTTGGHGGTTEIMSRIIAKGMGS